MPKKTSPKKLSPNDQIQQSVIKHQIYTLRFAAGNQNDINGIIKLSEVKLKHAVRDNLENIDKGYVNTPKQRKALKKLEKDVKVIRGDAINKARSVYFDDMTEFAQLEAQYSAKVLQTALPKASIIIPSKAVSQAIVRQGNWSGKIFNTWFKNLEDADTGRIMSTTLNGIKQGSTNAEIINSIIGTKKLGYKDGITNISRNSVNTLVRTTTNGVANDARNNFYLHNSDVISKVKFVATLDGRTTMICINNDGKTWGVDENYPIPPLHPNCRSTIVPIVADERLASSVGQRPAKGLDGKTDHVSANMTYEKFMKIEGKKFQDEVLGKTRAELWRKGKVPLGNFVDNSGKTYTLKQLAKKEGLTQKDIEINRTEKAKTKTKQSIIPPATKIYREGDDDIASFTGNFKL